MNQTTNVKLVAEISATSKGLVEALGKASAAVNEAAGGWKDKFATLKDSTSLVGQSIKNLSDLVSQVGKVDMDVEGMERINASISEVTAQFDKVKGEVDDFTAKLVEMKNAASDLGMPVEDYQRFADAVKAAGLSMDEGAGMLQAMRQNILDFANGVPEASRLFAGLGLTIEQLSSNTVSANFEEIVRALNDTVTASERATQNMQMFKASIDKTLAVVDQYNKATSRQEGSYASDKDVQNAISLSNAIGKLGEQLSGYATAASGASNASNASERSFADLFDIVKNNQDVFSALWVEYANYVNSLKSGASSALDASKALEVLRDKMLEFEVAALKGGTETLTMDKLRESVLQVADFLSSSSERIKDEMTAVNTIMNQRISAGPPVDVSEMETAVRHIDDLKVSIISLREAAKVCGVEFSERLDNALNDLDFHLDKSAEKFDELREKAAGVNFSQAFEAAEKSVSEFQAKLEKATQDLEKGIRVHIDTTEIDKAREKLNEFSLTGWTDKPISVIQPDIDRLKSDLDELRQKASEFNQEVSRGVPLWNPITRAVSSVKDGVSSFGQGIAKAFRDGRGGATGLIASLRGVGNVIKEGVSHLTHFKAGLEESGESGKSLGTIMKQSVGQVLGMGTAVAIVAKAWRNICALVKEYAKNVAEAQEAVAYGNAGDAATDMTRVREKSDKNREELTRKLEDFAELYDEWRKTGSESVGAKLGNLRDELKRTYQFSFRETNGIIEDIDAQIAQHLRKLTQSRIQAIEAQMKANREVIDGATDYINSFGYWKRLGYQFAGGAGRYIEKAQGRSTEAADQNLALLEEKNRLERESLDLQYLRTRNAKLVEEEKARRREQPIGRWGEGNIDLYDRPIYRNEDGSISTVDSMSFNENGKEVLIPTIARDAQGNAVRLSEEQAIRRYQITGEHLGKFDSVAEANDYAERLHKEQEKMVNALEEGTRRLEEWSASLGDNDRQRNLRAIIAKYNAIVEQGVDAGQAWAVAERAIAKMLEQEQKDEEQKNKELLDALQQRIDQYKDAYQSYEQSRRDVVDAQREYARTQRELADQARRERLQRRHESLQRKMSRFGFTPYEGFRLDESEARRSRRKRNVELDAGISEKMSRSQAGERVSWTSAERQRIAEYQRLERKDKAVQAAMKQMDAAASQRAAAKSLKDAADAIKDATKEQTASLRELVNARGNLAEAARNPMTRSVNGAPGNILGTAMTQGLNARGVSGAWQVNQQGYGPQFNLLHQDLQGIRNNVWTVK